MDSVYTGIGVVSPAVTAGWGNFFEAAIGDITVDTVSIHDIGGNGGPAEYRTKMISQHVGHAAMIVFTTVPLFE